MATLKDTEEYSVRHPADDDYFLHPAGDHLADLLPRQ